MLVELLISMLCVVGSVFALVGSVGLARLPDIFSRLHGPTKATTVGVGAIVIASLVYWNTIGDVLSLRELAISLFLFITAPISAHLISKAAEKIAHSARNG